MFCWRITKYDPKKRDTKGSYIHEEWTSYSDIGKTFKGAKLERDQYYNIENKYIESILLFMDCLNVQSLQVVDLEKHHQVDGSSVYPNDMLVLFNLIKNHENLDKKKIAMLSRLILRENVWCRLESKKMFVHFGYDYYMYIGSIKLCEEAISNIQKMGLFVEEYKSPYGEN